MNDTETTATSPVDPEFLEVIKRFEGRLERISFVCRVESASGGVTETRNEVRLSPVRPAGA